MSIFGGISSWLTGGRDKQAEQALNNAMAAYGAIKAPTQEELSLPQLQQYVQAGIMTPAEAQAYLQQSNAFQNQNIDQSGTAAQQQALAQLSGIANAGPMGTPVEQAQVAQAIQQMNNAVQGQRGAIEQQMAAKGTPGAMIQAALANQYAGQDASQGYQNSLQAQAQAYQSALNALAAKGTLGGQLQGQQNTQANTVANAANAMQQFNAANQQQNSQFNAANKQAANLTNLNNAQNVSNQNVGTANSRTAYNTGQRQTAFDDAMARAQGISNVATGQANNYQQMGQQAAGTAAGIFGGISNLVNNALMPTGAAPASAGAAGASSSMVGPEFAGLLAHGGIVDSHKGCYHDGGICMEGGGMIPGKAPVRGDSLRNDKVHIMASPGEAVIPRTVVAAHPQQVMGLIAQGRGNVPQGTPAHPHDIASVLEALRALRTGSR